MSFYILVNQVHQNYIVLVFTVITFITFKIIKHSITRVFSVFRNQFDDNIGPVKTEESLVDIDSLDDLEGSDELYTIALLSVPPKFRDDGYLGLDFMNHKIVKGNLLPFVYDYVYIIQKLSLLTRFEKNVQIVYV